MRARWLALLAIMILVIAACGGDDSDSGSGDESEETTEETSDETEETSDETADTDGETDDTEGETDDDDVASGDCGDFAEDLEALEDAGASADDPAAAIAALQDSADAFQDAVDSAPEEIRDDVQVLADAFSSIADDLEDLDLEALENTDDPEDLAAAFAALGPLFEAFADQDVIEASLNIAQFCGFEGAEDLGDLGDVTVPDFEGLLGGEGESGNPEAYSDCFNDFEADGPGDNDGCDTLYDLCDEGDLLACNDLYFSANVGSEYEHFGATCGDRIATSDQGANGFCENADI